jgi:DNA-binding response OmpR family regulator
MRVLIIEDERAVSDQFRDHLIDLGHDAIVAPSAEDALRMLTSGSPDAIVLDLGLPGIDGLEFLRLPAVLARSIPVIVISGTASEAQARDCLKYGALDFVRKPVPLSRLSEVLGFLELHVLNAQLVEQVRNLDRRRYARVPAVFPVRIIEYAGAEWLGMSVDISPFGMKLRGEKALKEGATAKLHFTPTDGPPSITLLSVLVRIDPDGQAFYFVNLTKAEFQRLSAIVQSLGNRSR